MKLAEVQEQGSSDWLEFRKTHIGASDLPIILGLSRWSSPLDLWRTKLGFVESKQSGFAASFGHRMEPKLRNTATITHLKEYVPIVCTHDEYEWASASLDGYCKDSGEILEIKCANQVDHASARDKRIPDCYWPQVQWQLFVAGAKHGVYMSYNKETVHYVHFERDQQYIDNTLLPAAIEFHRMLVEMEAPDISSMDSLLMDDEMKPYADAYIEASRQLKRWSEKKELAKENLISSRKYDNCQGYGLSLKKCHKQGSIDYKRLWLDVADQHKDINPENYRKDSTELWRLSIKGDE